MKKLHQLVNVGIEKPLELFGSLTIIQKVENAPIVFLFDENHDNPNDCFKKNFENAIELIKKANVVLVGVESHSGGREWDQFEEVYIDEIEYELASDKTIVNSCPQFANSLLAKYPNVVYGVESFGLLGKIEVDYAEDHPRAVGTAIPDHIFQKDRSKHFIRTLFEIVKLKSLNGNLILNCGSNHNADIQKWIESGEIIGIVGAEATYIRLNTYQ